MTATFATSARPPKVAIAWATKTALFCEIPTASGPPYVYRERLTVEGLARVLGILIEVSDAAPPRPTPSHPAIKKAKPVHGDEASRARAAEIVRGMTFKAKE